MFLWIFVSLLTLLVSTGCLINIAYSIKSNLKGECHIDGTPCTWHTPFEYRYSVWSSYLHYWSQYTLDAKVLLFGQIHIIFSKNNLVGTNLNKPFFFDITAKEPKLSLIITSGFLNRSSRILYTIEVFFAPKHEFC